LEIQKNNFNLSLFTIALISVVIFFFSCEEPDVVGLQTQIKNDKLNISFSDTTSIIAFSQIEDKVRSDELTSNLLGSYFDPVFGTTSASLYTQLRLSSSNVTFGISPIFDSLILSFAYSGSYGDTTVPMEVKVYEITENMYKDSTYYSNQDFTYNNYDLADSIFIPKPNDSVDFDNEKYAPHLQIKLDKILGDKFLYYSRTSDFASSENFINFFKGLYITMESQNNKGAILYFDLLSSLSKLTLYYHNNTDTSHFNFIINENCARVNTFEHNNYSDANVDLKNQTIRNDTSLGGKRVYIQSMAGIRTKIKFPYLKNWLDSGKIAINSAELVFDIDESDVTINDYSPPERLGLVKLDKEGELYFVSDYNEGDTHFGGYYNETKKEYRFRISSHIQEMLEDNIIDYGLILLANERQTTANRVILNGPNGLNGKLRLEIIYTKLY